MSDESRIHTDFMDRQAKESARGGPGKKVLISILALLIGGIAFGAFKLSEFFGNFDFFQYKRNVSIILKSPKVVSGNAVVTVEVRNQNAADISEPVFSYTIESRDGKPLSAGQVKIDGTVPAADGRSFEDVVLGPVAGEPARMHTDLIGLSHGPVEHLPKGYSSRFAGAYENPGELIASLKKLAAEAPTSAVPYIALGLAYESQEDWPSAQDAYQKAVELEPNNANAHYHLGLALKHDNDLSSAIGELTKAQELSPKDKTIAKALIALGPASSASSNR